MYKCFVSIKSYCAYKLPSPSLDALLACHIWVTFQRHQGAYSQEDRNLLFQVFFAHGNHLQTGQALKGLIKEFRVPQATQLERGITTPEGQERNFRSLSQLNCRDLCPTEGWSARSLQLGIYIKNPEQERTGVPNASGVGQSQQVDA